MTLEGQDITLTRGDSATIKVSISGGSLATGDVVELTVRRTVNDPEKLLYYKITSFTEGKAIINFTPAETEKLCFGTYVYDVQLSRANGLVATIIKPHKFIIDTEVTY